MANIGIELELSFLLAVAILGTSFFAPFEVETPPRRKLLKWTFVATITLVAYRYVGHWALLPPTGLALLGLTFHFVWCRKNGIDPVHATPRRRYYELRGWKWHE